MLDGNPGTPAENHHPREKAGMSEKAEDKEVYPLCPIHHRTGTTIPSVHLRPIQFHARYGSSELLTELTRAGVQTMLNNTIGKRA